MKERRNSIRAPHDLGFDVVRTRGTLSLPCELFGFVVAPLQVNRAREHLGERREVAPFADLLERLVPGSHLQVGGGRVAFPKTQGCEVEGKRNLTSCATVSNGVSPDGKKNRRHVAMFVLR